MKNMRRAISESTKYFFGFSKLLFSKPTSFGSIASAMSRKPSVTKFNQIICAGKIGTEVAKEAADIVLLDDNFGSIISAVEEGRSIYKTIKKIILYLFST